jgi:hypothetical protein
MTGGAKDGAPAAPAAARSTKDESVNFSLKELMKLEDERIDQEKRAREAREQAAMAARQEAERKTRAELEANERAAAEERERARFREMEEEARREAIQHAAVEQARITVEARTRADESERERRHEIELQRMRTETVKKPGPGGFIGSALAGAAFAFATCLVLHFAVAQPAADKRAAARVAELERAVASAESRANELSGRIEFQTKQIGSLKTQVEALQTDNAKLVADARVKPKSGGGGGGPVPQPTGPKPRNPNDGPPCLNKWDPLCPHVGN